MHKAVQEVEERHVHQIVLMEKINIEKGVPPVEIRRVDRQN
jgi:hypothetical protein